MRTILIWAVLNGGLAGCSWAGWWLGVEGARNMAAALVVFCCLVGLILTFSDRPTPVRPPLPRTLQMGSRLVAWFVLVTLVWHGAFWLASTWAGWMLMSFSYRQRGAECSGA